MGITNETRREAYEAVKPKILTRARLLMLALENGPQTVSELAMELFELGEIPYYDRNFVAPRLTELKKAGLVETCGRRKSIRSNKTEAVWRRTAQ